jgi:predicted anti-sigma-YlaC factor YlaD
MAVQELSCRELVELVTDYLEGKLSPTEQARFEAHLSGCSGCRNYLEQMRSTVRMVSKLSEDHLAAESRDELLQRFRHWKLKPGDATESSH